MKFMLFPYVFFTLLFCTALNAQAQDLIITKSSDSIFCKIIAVNDSIKSMSTAQGVITYKNIANADVKTYVFSYYAKDALPEKYLQRQHRANKATYGKHKSEAQFYTDNRFRFSLNFLYAVSAVSLNIYDKNNAIVMNEILGQAKNNIGFLGDIYMALNKSRSFLIGVEYSEVIGSGTRSNSKMVITNYNGSNTYYGKAQIDIALRTYGINTMYLLPFKKAFNHFYLVLGVALTKYVEEFSIGSYKETNYASGNAYNGGAAYNIGIKYDYMLSKNWAIGTDLTVNPRTLSISNITESTTRGSLALGFRYHL